MAVAAVVIKGTVAAVVIIVAKTMSTKLATMATAEATWAIGSAAMLVVQVAADMSDTSVSRDSSVAICLDSVLVAIAVGIAVST